MATEAAMQRVELKNAVEELIYREAALLDAKKWREWLELYAEDAVFWMPTWASEYEPTSDPELELNLMYLKGRAHLEDRVFRIETGDSFASVPMARTAHVVSGVLVEGVHGVEVDARASWIVHSFGLHGAITRGGWYEYRLRPTEEGLRIARKKIVMVDDKLVGPVDVFHV
jgi:3-phenylpropionate/cinnamic acid dioxygenase small subunit